MGEGWGVRGRGEEGWGEDGGVGCWVQEDRDGVLCSLGGGDRVARTRVESELGWG